MRFFSREASSYAVLLLVLFVMAAVAVYGIIRHIQEILPDNSATQFVVFLIWTLTMGFMFLAGAFGLWAIQFAAQAESSRRVGRFVDAMDFLSDGLLSLDDKGRIIGSNPAARRLAGQDVINDKEHVRNVFTCLGDEDVSILLDESEPHEVEADVSHGRTTRSLRFRSQPSEDLTLLFVSDVTSLNAQRTHNRQVARLQLIGQLARGVAHDFNDLLCSMSGHASLLERLEPGSPEMNKCAEAINQHARKGIALASHLLELAQPNLLGTSTDTIIDHIRNAAGLLRDTLPDDWQVATDLAEKFVPVGLSGIQIEQAVLNLGMLAAEEFKLPATLHITLRPTDDSGIFNVGRQYAGALLLTLGAPVHNRLEEQTLFRETTSDSGVIQSVIDSMLQEAGGRLNSFVRADGTPVYRIVLPHSHIGADPDGSRDIPAELKTYIATWSVLVAHAGRERPVFDRLLEKFVARMERVNTLASLLANIEEQKQLDAILLDKQLLGNEAPAILKAILKLRPTAGIVALTEDPGHEPRELAREVIFVSSSRSSPAQVVRAIVDSKALSSKRKNHPTVSPV